MRGWGKREWAAAAGIGLVAIALGIIAIDRGSRGSNDFDNFHAAGAAVWNEGTLYLEKGTLRYPPSFQVMMSPLGALPIAWAAAVWVLLNYAAFAVLPWAFSRLSGLPPSRLGWAFFAVAPFIVNNVTLGQSGPLLLAAATLGILAAAQGRATGGAALIALAGFYKVFPAALLAVPFALRRIPGVLAGTALAAIGVSSWVALAIGPREGLDDLARWFHEVRTEQSAERFFEVVRGLRYNNQGLAVTIVRSFTTDFSWAPKLAAKGSVQLLSLPLPVAWGFYYTLVALIAACSAAFAWRVRRAPTTRDFLGLYALATPAMLAVSPLVWTHYFLWLLPCFVYLLPRTRLVAGLGALSLLAVFSVPARALGFHIWMSLLLFVLVARQLWHETAPAWSAEPAREQARD